jgi:hypothetical protein
LSSASVTWQPAWANATLLMPLTPAMPYSGASSTVSMLCCAARSSRKSLSTKRS